MISFWVYVCKVGKRHKERKKFTNLHLIFINSLICVCVYVYILTTALGRDNSYDMLFHPIYAACVCLIFFAYPKVGNRC